LERKVMNKSKDAPGAVDGRPPIYTPIHKGIRNKLFEVSVKAGRIDYADQAALNGFYDEFSLLVASIRGHHTMEENFYHPLLAERVPGGAEKLEEDHQAVEHLMNNLKAHLDGIRSKSTEFEKRRELGLEFYLAFNRFIAFFLNHIDGEEEYYEPALRNLCTIEELEKTEVSLIGSQKPEEGLQNLQMMLAAASVADLAELMARARAALPPEVIQGGFQLAQGIMSAQDLAALKAKLGVK
jgi:hemerythrin-like domain-containing protein